MESFDVQALRTSVLRAQPEVPAEAVVVAADAVMRSAKAVTAEDALNTGWKRNKELYSLRYSMNEKSVVIKVLDMEDAAIIHAMVDGQEEMANLEVNYEDMLRDEPDFRSADDLYSLGLITFIANFNRSIVQPLQDRTASGASSSRGRTQDKTIPQRQEHVHQQQQQQQDPFGQEYPSRTPTGIVVPPEPYDPFSPHPRNPLSIGEGDLRGPGFGGSRGGWGGDPGQGMYVGPDHPMFAGRGGRPGASMPGAFPDAPGMIPGARFDPVGPFGNPGRGRGPGQLDPDNDLHQPPRGPGYDHFL